MKLPTAARLVTTGLTALTLAVVPGTPASASDTTAPGLDLALAIESNTLLRTVAAKHAVLYNAAHPNISCDIPKAVGVPVSPYFKVATLTNEGADGFAAEGHCFSFTAEDFTAYLTATVEWYDEPTDDWIATGCSRTESRDAEGVAVVYLVEPLCVTDAVSWRKPHQVKAVLTSNRFTDSYVGYSPVYTN